MRPNPIKATVDFEADGIQHGYLKVPYSGDDSAWGAVMIPITVIKSGEGPTALLTGANHGIAQPVGILVHADAAHAARAESTTTERMVGVAADMQWLAVLADFDADAALPETDAADGVDGASHPGQLRARAVCSCRRLLRAGGAWGDGSGSGDSSDP